MTAPTFTRLGRFNFDIFVKMQKILKKGIDILLAVWYNIDSKGGENMKQQKKKPTAFEVVDLIIKAIVAIAALITAIKWW